MKLFIFEPYSWAYCEGWMAADAYINTCNLQELLE